MRRDVGFYVPILAAVGGLIALLSVFYFTESFAYSIGYNSGIVSAISAYNITNATSSAVPALQAMTDTFRLGSHIAYAMIFLPLIMLGISAFWMFVTTKGRTLQIVMVIVSLMFLLMVTLLVENFHFSNSLTVVIAAYAGALICLGSSSYFIYDSYVKAAVAPHSRAVRSLEIDPAKPYSNIDLIAKKLFGSFFGEVRILDMHFDSKAVQNLSMLIDRSSPKFSRILVLMSKDRAGDMFRRNYNEFGAELANRGISLEVRIMNDDDLATQHERLILDDSKAYKIPPFNIINKKSEHIVSVNYKQASEHFGMIWNRAAKLENFGKGNTGKSM